MNSENREGPQYTRYILRSAEARPFPTFRKKNRTICQILARLLAPLAV
nr:MAG TPA: hypothetical protein [Microviridae sp.]